ncbi:MAG: hypothetical protein OXI05_03390 [Bacteroidota bacterium]|nr:hypothetical protein [Bacteroidota bacterium]MDE2644869.1 hypothetical protein [Bacteroidota bacterium]
MAATGATGGDPLLYMPRSKKSAKSHPRRRRVKKRSMILSTHNYVLVALGVLAIVLGYAIMRLENEVDGFLSLYVAPLLILGGYLEIIYAILWRNSTHTGNSARSAE